MDDKVANPGWRTSRAQGRFVAVMGRRRWVAFQAALENSVVAAVHLRSCREQARTNHPGFAQTLAGTQALAAALPEVVLSSIARSVVSVAVADRDHLAIVLHHP